jgi:GT2 family glycosyltransferase
VFDEVGLFRPDLVSGGDGDWGERASRMGVLTHFVPDQVVYHPARYHFSSLCRQRMRHIDGRLQGERRGLTEPAEVVRRCRPGAEPALGSAVPLGLGGMRRLG